MSPTFDTDFLSTVLTRKSDLASLLIAGLENLPLVEELKQQVACLQSRLRESGSDEQPEVRETLQREAVIEAQEVYRLNTALSKELLDRRAEIDALKKEITNLEGNLKRTTERANKAEVHILQASDWNECRSEIIDSISKSFASQSALFQTALNLMSENILRLVPLLTTSQLESSYFTKLLSLSPEKLCSVLQTTQVCQQFVGVHPRSLGKLTDMVILSALESTEKAAQVVSSLNSLAIRLKETPEKANEVIMQITESAETTDIIQNIKDVLKYGKEVNGIAFYEFVGAFIGWRMKGSEGNGLEAWTQRLAHRNSQYIHKMIEKLFITALRNNFPSVVDNLYEVIIEKQPSGEDCFGKVVEQLCEWLEASQDTKSIWDLIGKWSRFMRNSKSEEVEHTFNLFNQLFRGGNNSEEERQTLRLVLKRPKLRKAAQFLPNVLKHLSEPEKSRVGFAILNWLSVEERCEIGLRFLQEIDSICLSDGLFKALSLLTDLCQLFLLTIKKETDPMFLQNVVLILNSQVNSPEDCSDVVQTLTTCIREGRLGAALLLSECHKWMLEVGFSPKEAKAFVIEFDSLLVLRWGKTLAEKLIKLGIQMKTRLPREESPIPLIAFMLESARSGEEGIEDFIAEALEQLATNRCDNLTVLKIVRLHQSTQISARELTAFLHSLQNISKDQQPNVGNLLSWLSTTSELAANERAFSIRITVLVLTTKITESLVLQSLISERSAIFATLRKGTFYSNTEQLCAILAMLCRKPTTEMLLIANSLLVLLPIFEANFPLLSSEGADFIVAHTHYRVETNITAIEGGLKLLPELVRKLRGLVLDVNIGILCCALLAQVFTCSHPLLIIKSAQDPYIFRQLKHFLVAQPTLQTILTFQVMQNQPRLGSVEKTQMKLFHFEPGQHGAWGNPIQLDTCLNVAEGISSVFLSDHRLFVCGGSNGNYLYTDTYILDGNGNVQSLGRMHTSRYYHPVVFHPGKQIVFVGGGYLNGCGNYSRTAKSEMFKLEKLAKSPDLWQWDTLPDMNQVGSSSNACLFRGLIYFCGYMAKLEVFNPETLTFTTTSIAQPEDGPNSAYIESDRLIYITNTALTRYKIEGGILVLDNTPVKHPNHEPWQNCPPVIHEGKIYMVQYVTKCVWMTGDEARGGVIQ